MRKDIDVAEYCNALEAWAGVARDEDRFMEEVDVEFQKKLIRAGCDDLRSRFNGTVPIGALCTTLSEWASAQRATPSPWRGPWSRVDAAAWEPLRRALGETALPTEDAMVQRLISDIRLAVGKSCLLDRMIYAGEPLRTEPCPIHKGRWSGWDDPCPEGCSFGPSVTGWLRPPAIAVPKKDGAAVSKRKPRKPPKKR